MVLRVRGQQGFAVSHEGGEVVALDLNLDEGLRKRGLSRDVVRLVQDLRKASGLDVSDRIRLHVVGLDVIAEFFDFIGREVLAVSIVSGPGEGEGTCWTGGRPARRAGAGLARAGRPRRLTRRRSEAGVAGEQGAVSAIWTPPVAAGSSTTRSPAQRTMVMPAWCNASVAAPRSSTRSARRCVRARS